MIFQKNLFFEKFENWIAFDQNSLTITHETAKHDGKNRKFSQKALGCCRALVHAWSSALQCGKKKNLSHMEAQKSKSYYKS